MNSAEQTFTVRHLIEVKALRALVGLVALLTLIGEARAQDIVYGTYMAANSHGSAEPFYLHQPAFFNEQTIAFRFRVPPDIDYTLTRIETTLERRSRGNWNHAYYFDLFEDLTVGSNPAIPPTPGSTPMFTTDKVNMQYLPPYVPELVKAFPPAPVILEKGKAYWIRAHVSGGCFTLCPSASANWMLNSAGVVGDVVKGSFWPSFSDPQGGGWDPVATQALPAFRVVGEPTPDLGIKAAYTAYATTGTSNETQVTLYPEVFCPGPVSQFFIEVDVTVPAGANSAEVCVLLADKINNGPTICHDGAIACPGTFPFGFSATCAGNVLRVTNDYASLTCNPDGFVCADRGNNVDIFRRSMSSDLLSVEGQLKLHLIGQASGIVEDPSYNNSLRVIHMRRCAGGQRLQVFDAEVPLLSGMLPIDIVQAMATALTNLGDPDVFADGTRLVIDAATDCPSTTPMLAILDSVSTPVEQSLAYVLSGANELATVDLGANCTITTIGLTQDAGGGPLRDVRSMVFDHDGGVLYGMTPEGDLVTIDRETAATTPLLQLPFGTPGSERWGGLSFDGNVLYAVNYFAPKELVNIDLNTLTSTLMGIPASASGFQHSITDMDLFPASLPEGAPHPLHDRFYVFDQNSRISTIDPVSLLVSTPLSSSISNTRALAFNPEDGVLYTLQAVGSDSRLSTFDFTTNQLTEVCLMPMSVTSAGGGLMLAAPPTSGSAAIGVGEFHVDVQTNELTYDIQLSALEGAVTAVHLHGPAPVGGTGPILFDLPIGLPMTGMLTYSEALEAALLAGEMYLDVHTTAHAGAEIRGHIVLSEGPPAQGPANYDITVKLNDDGLGFALSPLDDLFALVAGSIGSNFCAGDGTGNACPCGNLGGAMEGCSNTSGAGAVLSGSGSANVGADDLALNGVNLLPGQPALLFVGDTQLVGGFGIPFGDGLRCAGGNVLRLGVRLPNASGAASWGPGLNLAGGWLPGDTRNFQVWYRDPSGPCGGGFNLSNGLAVQFQ